MTFIGWIACLLLICGCSDTKAQQKEPPHRLYTVTYQARDEFCKRYVGDLGTASFACQSAFQFGLKVALDYTDCVLASKIDCEAEWIPPEPGQ